MSPRRILANRPAVAATARRAFTLVEVLAVTVLLGLLATLGVPPLLRVIGGDPLAKAAGRLAQTFRDARAQAYGHRLSLGLESWGFGAVSSDDGGRTGLPSLHLPESIHLSWTRNGKPAQLLDLDPRGHGLDTDVVLRQDGRELVFTIDGLTGTWTPRAPP